MGGGGCRSHNWEVHPRIMKKSDVRPDYPHCLPHSSHDQSVRPMSHISTLSHTSAMTNLCRDECTTVLKDKIEAVFGGECGGWGVGVVLVASDDRGA